MSARKPDPVDFSTLPETLRPLAERSPVRRYRKGTLLIEEGDRGDCLYIILAGSLRAFSGNDAGREITYGVYGPGEYLGEMSLDGGARAASVEVVETCTCAVVVRQTLTLYIAEHPDFAFELLAKVIRRARAATFTAKQLALNDVYGRLKLLLESLAEAQFDGTRLIRQRPTHLEISQRLGCGREMVSRILKDLEVAAIIRPEFERLRLLRPLPARW